MRLESHYSFASRSMSDVGENLLINAVNGGDVEDLRRVMQRADVIIGARDVNGSTAFMHAARSNNVKMMELLSPRDLVGLNQRNDAGETAMMQAAKNKSLDAILWLIRAGAEVNITDNSKSTAFFEYLRSLDPHAEPSAELVREFLCGHLDLTAVDAKGRNSLMLMAQTHGEVKYKFLEAVRAGIDINAKDLNGCTAVYLATESFHFKFAWELVMKGALAHLTADDGRRAQDVAEDAGLPGLAKILDDAGDAQRKAAMAAANREKFNALPAWTENYGSIDTAGFDDEPSLLPKDGDKGRVVEKVFVSDSYERDYSELGIPPLFAAVKAARREDISAFLKAGDVNVNAQDLSGMTALMWAAESGEEGLLKFFLDEVAANKVDLNMNLVSWRGESALMAAARIGSGGNMKALLQSHTAAKINVNIVEGLLGHNALMIYVRDCLTEIDAEVVQLLLKAKLDLRCVDVNRRTAITLFPGKIGTRAKEVFMKGEGAADAINVVDSHKVTALLRSVYARDFEYFKLLIGAGAEHDVPVNGLLARSVAEELKLTEFVKFIDGMPASVAQSSAVGKNRARAPRPGVRLA